MEDVLYSVCLFCWHLAANVDIFGVWVHQKSGVHQRLVVNVLISSCRLSLMIEHECAPELGRCNDLDVLEFRFGWEESIQHQGRCLLPEKQRRLCVRCFRLRFLCLKFGHWLLVAKCAPQNNCPDHGEQESGQSELINFAEEIASRADAIFNSVAVRFSENLAYLERREAAVKEENDRIEKIEHHFSKAE